MRLQRRASRNEQWSMLYKYASHYVTDFCALEVNTSRKTVRMFSGSGPGSRSLLTENRLMH